LIRPINLRGEPGPAPAFRLPPDARNFKMALLPCQPHGHATETFRKSPTKSQRPAPRGPGNRCLRHHRATAPPLPESAAGGMGAEYPTFEEVSAARVLLLLADSTPPPALPSPPPTLRYFPRLPRVICSSHHRIALHHRKLTEPPLRRASPHYSDEFFCYSGSSSSYSGVSARSCVSDSAQRGRPVDPLRVLSVVASLRRLDPKVCNPVPRLMISTRLRAASSAVTH
jgi:hypothetical protein